MVYTIDELGQQTAPVYGSKLKEIIQPVGAVASGALYGSNPQNTSNQTPGQNLYNTIFGNLETKNNDSIAKYGDVYTKPQDTVTDVPKDTTTEVVSTPKDTTTTNTTYTPTKNNSDTYNQMYDNNLQSVLAKIRQAIAKGTSDQQQIIANAPKQYQPLKNEASYKGAVNLQNLREMLANGGQQGGVNRTDETAVNTATGNNINNLNMQQQKVIDEANKTIADLESQGRFDEAQATADNASQRLQALINENNRVDDTNYSRLRDSIGDTRYADETAYNRATQADNTAYSRLRDTIGDKRYNQEWQNQLDQQDFNNNMETAKFNWDTDLINNPQNASIIQSMSQDQAKFDEWKAQAPQRAQQLVLDIKNAQTAADIAILEKKVKNNELIASNMDLKNKSTLDKLNIDKFKNEMKIANEELKIKKGELAVSQKNAETSRMNAETSKTKASNSAVKKADDSKLTAKQKADLKAKAYTLATTANFGETPSEDQVNNLYNYLVGGEETTTTPTNTTSKTNDYTKISGYSDDLNYAKSQGSKAVSEIKANKDSLTATYGQAGYESILKAAGGGK